MSTLHVENLKGPTSGANANKIIVPSGQTLTASGHVIQAAFTVNSLITSTTSTSYSDLLSLSFTPKFNNSMLFIISTIRYQENTTNQDIKIKITHDGSDVMEISRYFTYSGATNLINTNTIQAFISSTGSTSARDIKVQVGQISPGTSYYNVNNSGADNSACCMTIYEIAQ